MSKCQKNLIGANIWQDKTDQWNSEREKLKKDFNELNSKATKLKEQADEWKKNSVRSDAFVNERDELLQAKARQRVTLIFRSFY